MANSNTLYSTYIIKTDEAREISRERYDLDGEITALPGELDFNFRIRSKTGTFVLKIMRPDTELSAIQFRQGILDHFKHIRPSFAHPESFPDRNGNYISEITDSFGNKRYTRLLSWINGRVWANVNPRNNELLFSLGEQAGTITKALEGFTHEYAGRKIDWDIAQGGWTFDFLHLFNEDQKTVVSHFQDRFRSIQDQYKYLRKSVVHNDGNDHNVIVSDNLTDPEVTAIIDYGDSVYTQAVNDLAITIAYAVMGKPDPLGAAFYVIKGYHAKFPLEEKELKFLYILVAMRLIISVTKSAINKRDEPDNKYLLISEEPAWELLKKWVNIDEKFAMYSFRHSCGFTAHPDESLFLNWAGKNRISLKALFPTLRFTDVLSPDMSMGSTWIGHESEYQDNELLAIKFRHLRRENSRSIIAGGYMEPRPFYCTEAYEREGNCGNAYRSIHLGLDIWTEPETPIHAVMDGVVHSIHNNDNEKDYGPTLIIKHQTDTGATFYTLYGHMTRATLKCHNKGDRIEKGDTIGYVGDIHENGSWAPHLHFQILLDMLGFETDFPGVAFPSEITTWKSICPDPSVLFKEDILQGKREDNFSDILSFRRDHLGKSLSLSYKTPLTIVRGSGVYLMDNYGRKYLDTVNNVAHVGHENPRVVKAGRDQMAVLNTNTRYLHENINKFADELLSTFPDQLSVAHFVNSGSEANELALRMAYASTGHRDMIALENGYHGNTNGCINISSYKFDGKGGRGAPEHTHIVPLPDSFRGMYRGADTGEKYSGHLKEQIEKVHAKGRKIAGFICESIVSCGGQIELPKNYLKTAYEYVRENGGLCIADEVQVGCGRVGKHFWGFQIHGVVPDIVTIGKPIGNGHPVAAVVCTREVADAFANGMEYFNTFGGNPVSCAVGLEVLRTIKEEKLQENSLNTGNYLKENLKMLQNEFPVIGDVRGQGLFLGFELTDRDLNPLTEKTAYLANRMKEAGILMSIDGKDNNVIKIKPPIIFSRKNADELTTRLISVFSEDFMKM